MAGNDNNTAHIRDVVRTGVHFKYPNVAFPGQDMTLGGNRYLIWGEFIAGENQAVTGAQTTQPTTGYYLEVDYAVNPSLLAFVRYDYYDQNTNVAEDHLVGITPGIRLPFLGSSALILEAEYYAGGTAAPATTADDRITLEVATMF